jgi:Spy/CpxP family protein refolding chaperone
MARHTRWALAALLLAAVAAPLHGRAPQADAPQAEAPPKVQQARDNRRDGNDRRPWWKNPKDMAEIGLTADQSATIDGIFHAEIGKMKPLRETVNSLERALDETMRANTADISAFARQVQKIENKRAELNTMRTVMLYRMRRVLNAEQNGKLLAMWDRREAERRKQDGDRRH